MVTISQTIQKIINDKIFILEPLRKGIISNVALAIQLKPIVEEELGKKVNTHAIVMALRRYSEEIQKTHKEITFDYSSEIILKTDICDIALLRSPTFFNKIKSLYNVVDFEKGDILNVIQGRHEVVIVSNERYLDKMLDIFKGEKIFNIEKNLVSLTLTFSSDFLHAPGVIYNVVRVLCWNNINIYEIVSTNTELTFILNKKDSSKAYDVLVQLVEKSMRYGT
ncbi:MAG: hypothetical protein R6V50_06855 [Thermoplasmatota archaeon]